jgi:hypothetical protein
MDSSGRMMIAGFDLFDAAQTHWLRRGFHIK